MSMIDPNITGRGRPEARGTRGKKTKHSARGPPRRRRQTLEPAKGGPLMSIPAAGLQYFGLSKNGSYDAAAHGEFGRLFKVGRRKFVVVANVERKIQAAIETDEDNEEEKDEAA
jgi:hypothetical protein